MASNDLRDPERLRAACEASRQKARTTGVWEWVSELGDFLAWFRDADERERASEEFQRKLWNDNPVSAAGQGNINVDGVIADESSRKWLAGELSREYPDSSIQRREQVVALFDSARERIYPLCSRQPWLKLFRVMATAFPRDFTTITDRATLKKLHHAMFEPHRRRALLCHFDIVDRLDEVLGPPEADDISLAERMVLPWLLYADVVLAAEDKPTEELVDQGRGTRLAPLPAARRRRGLTGISGGFQTILGILDFVGEGVNGEDLMEHIKGLLPAYKTNSLNTVRNALIGEWGVLASDSGIYSPTERGSAVLDSGDPSDLSDWLLTRILGVDAAVAALRDESDLTYADLIARIQACNPGWTTKFAPGSIASWLRSLGVIEVNTAGFVQLTATGQEWAARIHWTPEPLADDSTIPGEPDPVPVGVPAPRIDRPDLERIVSSVQAKGVFEERAIRDLHAGVWAHVNRHFGVLSGLSGTGKTLLATSYAEALWQGLPGTAERLCIITVQPGWYDPAALLGYVNPLKTEAYVRTPFLEFLLRAQAEPSVPYVVVLDEMNLSHPEQYLAPVLSAMETGAAISLHAEGPEVDGIPRSVPYPSNLVLIGTVNMDETTQGLSDKVLDRAFTLEFWDVDVAAHPGWNSVSLSPAYVQRTKAALRDLYAALRPARLHFGYRTVQTILGFLEIATPVAPDGEGEEDFVSALDSAVYAQVLPKLRGDDSPRFRAAMDAVARALEGHALPRSHARVEELQEDLQAMGTARFWR